MRCNRSICAKTRFWFKIVQADDFKIEKGEDKLSEYAWIQPGNSKANLHYGFCRTCAVRAFGQGTKAALGKFYVVAIAALNDVSNIRRRRDRQIDKYVDDRHDDYEHASADTRFLQLWWRPISNQRRLLTRAEIHFRTRNGLNWSTVAYVFSRSSYQMTAFPGPMTYTSSKLVASSLLGNGVQEAQQRSVRVSYAAQCNDGHIGE